MTQTHIQALRPCPVCGGRAVDYLRRQRFILPEGHPLAGGYDVAHCAVCNFVYADISATQADYDRFYERYSKYEDSQTSTGSGESPLDRERLAGVAATLRAQLPSAAARILDIGCANGGLLAALRDLGFAGLAGIDPSPACASAARERGVDGRQGSLAHLPEDIGRFDCVVLSHVLEHVLDVSLSLGRLRPLLRENGLVYIEVPDAERYDGYVYAPFQDFNTEHINHFSRAGLDNALQAAGFEPVAHGERMIRPSAKTLAPAVYGFYRWTGRTAAPAPQPQFRAAIQRYIDRSAELLDRIAARIDEALRESPELIVWGVGQLTLKLLADTPLAGAKIAAFVDSNPIHQGKRLAGAPILAPEAARGIPRPILISTLLHHQEILAQIRRMGLANPVILLPEPEIAASV